VGGGWTAGGIWVLLSGGNWGGLREVGDPKNITVGDVTRPEWDRRLAETQAEK
jgi:hypothetical protein